jgi:hypothetical protein
MKLLRRGCVGFVLLFGLFGGMKPAVAENLTNAIQTERMTVMEINKNAGQLVCVNSRGRVHVHKLTNDAVVVTDEKKTGDLGTLNTGDVIKAQLRAGRIQKIVVLRHAWHEGASPEQ